MYNPKYILKEPYNEDFCSYLEYHLTRTFASSEDKSIRELWCDGIGMPLIESQTSKKNVNDTRKIITRAWIGKDGQQEYELIVKFGKYSLRRYAKERSLIACVPSEETMDWIKIDIDNQKIEIQLK